MAGPFDLISSQNLFECKPVAPHIPPEASMGPFDKVTASYIVALIDSATMVQYSCSRNVFLRIF